MTFCYQISPVWGVWVTRWAGLVSMIGNDTRVVKLSLLPPKEAREVVNLGEQRIFLDKQSVLAPPAGLGQPGERGEATQGGGATNNSSAFLHLIQSLSLPALTSPSSPPNNNLLCFVPRHLHSSNKSAIIFKLNWFNFLK